MLKQQRLGNWECYNSGVVYAATHGRGIWKSNNYYQPLSVSVPEIESGSQSAVNTVKVFPNPAADLTNVSFSLAEDTRISVAVYDLKGSKLKTVVCGKLQKGPQTIQVELDGLAKGTYILSVSSEEDVLGTSRLIKLND